MHKNAPDCINHFSNFLGEHAPEPPSISVADISLFLYESSHSLFLIPSNYKPKRFNCSMFSKISPVAKYPIASVYLYKHCVLYKKYVLYKNMLIFREFFNTQSDQNILQNAPNCTTFSKCSQGS